MEPKREISGSLKFKVDSLLASTLSEEDLPLGALFFEADGTMRSLIAAPDNHPDAATVGIAMDFINYAFSKTEWMQLYLDDISNAYVESRRKSNFRLIKGGLDDS